jgi:hypothetical protein
VEATRVSRRHRWFSPIERAMKQATIDMNWGYSGRLAVKRRRSHDSRPLLGNVTPAIIRLLTMSV